MWIHSTNATDEDNDSGVGGDDHQDDGQLSLTT